MPTATITSKGQVTIPFPVRRQLGLKAGDRVDFVIEQDGTARLAPKRVRFEEVSGMLKRSGRRAVTVRQMDSKVANTLRRKWRRE